MMNDNVREYWDKDRGWKWDILRKYITKACCDRLKAIIFLNEEGI